MPPTKTISPREIRVQEALVAIESGFFSISAAAKAFNLPRSTLQDRIKAKSASTPTSTSIIRGGHNKKLNKSQETVLCEWLERSARHGFPPRQDHIHQMADKLLRESGTSSSKIGKHWVERFLKRNPQYRTRRNKPLDIRRHATHNRRDLATWLKLYNDVVTEFNLEPRDIWNMDETGCFAGVNKPTHVVVPKSQKQVYVNDPQNREWITLIEAVSGAGEFIPPFVILTGEIHLGSWYQTKIPEDYILGVTKNGFSNSKIAMDWIKHWDKYTHIGRSRMLIIDGHDSHISVEFINYCFDHDIWLLCLPPHTTHLLQPLDVGCFQPLKHWLGLAVDESIRRYKPVSSSILLNYTN
jgi:transposase